MVDINKLEKEVKEEIKQRKEASKNWWKNHLRWKSKHGLPINLISNGKPVYPYRPINITPKPKQAPPPQKHEFPKCEYCGRVNPKGIYNCQFCGAVIYE